MLQLREIATPEPAADEVLIKVYASSVNPLDGYAMRGPLFFVPALGGLLRPKHKIAGADIAGTLKRLGRTSSSFSRATRSSEDRLGDEDWEGLPSMCAPVQIV